MSMRFLQDDGRGLRTTVALYQRQERFPGAQPPRWNHWQEAPHK